jgi:hypothetical protein
VILDSFALFLLGDPRDLPEESKRAMKELLSIDKVAGEGGAGEQGGEK